MSAEDPGDREKDIIHLDSSLVSGRAIWPPAAPITREDLLKVYPRFFASEHVEQLVDHVSRDLDEPGSFWSEDILLGVALLSPEHEQRMREYLLRIGWSKERIDESLARARAEASRANG
jgi:hypothetical protein